MTALRERFWTHFSVVETMTLSFSHGSKFSSQLYSMLFHVLYPITLLNPEMLIWAVYYFISYWCRFHSVVRHSHCGKYWDSSLNFALIRLFFFFNYKSALETLCYFSQVLGFLKFSISVLIVLSFLNLYLFHGLEVNLFENTHIYYLLIEDCLVIKLGKADWNM